MSKNLEEVGGKKGGRKKTITSGKGDSTWKLYMIQRGKKPHNTMPS